MERMSLFTKPSLTFSSFICVFILTCLVISMWSKMSSEENHRAGQRLMKSHCDENSQRKRYLHILMHSLTGVIYQSQSLHVGVGEANKLAKEPFKHISREEGRDWPEVGYTMVGTKALKNIQSALETVMKENVPGDFLEAGVWRGGASIFAKGVLRAYGEDHTRKVWVCDSFKGLPKPSSKKDGGKWEKMKALKVDKRSVQENFKRFDLLDDNVEFVEGYFVHSLPKIRNQVESIAVLRADGDMYESTMDILFNLYDKLSVGGMCIIDDYNIGNCQRAVTEFRKMHDIDDIIIPITDDKMKRYWIKTKQFSLKQQWYEKFLASRKPYLKV